MSLNRVILRVYKVCIWLIIMYAAFIISKASCRIFVGDWFPVNTSSMEPTIMPGDKIWVNKLIFGARIYKNLDFLRGDSLQTWRVKGWRKIKRGDVVVFNAPIQPSEPDSIAFRIDYVYVKRCAGVPGDTLWIPSDGGRRNTGRRDGHRFPMAVYVPQKGDTLYFNRHNWRLYHTVVDYETKGKAPQKYHVFQNNYYFMCGDNALHSFDSRSFGFVPEEFIIGVSKRNLFNNKGGWNQKFLNRRIFKRLK